MFDYTCECSKCGSSIETADDVYCKDCFDASKEVILGDLLDGFSPRECEAIANFLARVEQRLR